MKKTTALDEVKSLTEKIRVSSARVDAAELMHCYADIERFIAITSRGTILKFDEFNSICQEYYRPLIRQRLETEYEKFRQLNTHIFLSTWTGRIEAHFEDGRQLTMEPYTVTTLIEKIDDQWKVTYTHESGTHPE